jgi:uncharacterized membrane protein
MICLAAPAASSDETRVTDTEALRIAQTHCVTCHARQPRHPAFTAPPKDVALETVEDLKRFAPQILAQTVVDRAMPLGNQTQMSEDERNKLGQWIAGLK